MYVLKNSPRSLVIRCIFIVIGVAIAAVAAPFIIYANLGSDPFTAFNQGVGATLGISFGMAVNIFNAFFFIVIVIVNRKMIHIATVAYLLLLGPLSDLFIYLFEPLLGGELPLIGRGASMVFGTVCVGVGLGIYQAAEFGAGPPDAFNQTIASRLNIPLRWERMAYDAILVVGALFLGGVINIGTLVGILLIGPIMAPTFVHVAALVHRLTGTDPTK